MKIAFYKSEHGTITDKVISFFTGSIYSHCEIVFSDGMCASSSERDGGIRFKQIQLGDHWDVFEVDNSYSEERAKQWFAYHDDNKYDYFGALGSLLNIDLSNYDKKFCSQACAIVLGIEENITPGELYHKLVNSKRIK